MERHRVERYGSSSSDSYHYKHSRGPSRFSDGPINHHSYSRSSPISYSIGGGFSSPSGGGIGGGGRDHRPFDSPPRYPSPGGFRPIGRGGFGGGGGGFNYNHLTLLPPPPPPLLSGQKRGFSGRGGSPDCYHGGNFAKLFVGSVPRTATEKDIRPLFEQHGRVLEVALIKDKKTGQQQGCCFIKYATSEDADRAIRALHNQHTLPGGVGPIQVRYADGERERLGTVEYKLFVGSLNKQATEKEVEEIFLPYGRVEDVYLMRDEMKQSRGCGFVKYSHREMAMAAINALNGIYTMRGCDQPLTVQFADPKRPRPVESRGAPAFGVPGSGSWFQAPDIRPPPNLGEPMHGCVPPSGWHPMSPKNLGQSGHGFGSQFLPGSGDTANSLTEGGPFGGIVGSADGPLPGLAVSSSLSQQGFNQPLPPAPPVSQQISPLHRPLQSPQNLPSSVLLQPQVPASFALAQTSNVFLRQLGQLQLPHSAGLVPFTQALPSEPLPGMGAQFLVSQSPVQQNASSAAAPAPLSNNSQPNVQSAIPCQPQLHGQQQLVRHLHQSPSQLAQMLLQQTQSLHASFQSSQQAFSQLQQQLQMMQPSNQILTRKQSSHSDQSPWAGIPPQTIASTPSGTAPADVPPATSAAPALPMMTCPVAPVKCNWTEHTSPDGFKYYYNSTTGESRWEKPEELVLFEQQQQQQKSSVQQLQAPSKSQSLSVQQVSQMQQLQVQSQVQTQVQSQLRHPQQLIPTSQPPLYQAPGVASTRNIHDIVYEQLPVAAAPMNDPARYQQGLQAAQEWMRKNKPAAT